MSSVIRTTEKGIVDGRRSNRAIEQAGSFSRELGTKQNPKGFRKKFAKTMNSSASARISRSEHVERYVGISTPTSVARYKRNRVEEKKECSSNRGKPRLQSRALQLAADRDTRIASSYHRVHVRLSRSYSERVDVERKGKVEGK